MSHEPVGLPALEGTIVHLRLGELHPSSFETALIDFSSYAAACSIWICYSAWAFAGGRPSLWEWGRRLLYQDSRYSMTAVRAAIRWGKLWWWYISVFNCEKNDSATALSQTP